MSFTSAGESEGIKAAYHGALGLLALGALGYNIRAFTRRREWHLGCNVLLYGVLAMVESRKVRRHWDAR